jgi:outer membrane protein assembly factor BamB
MRILVVGVSGRVLGLDRASGDVVWRVPLRDAAREEVFLTVTTDTVYASAHAPHVFAFDYQTGILRWTADTTCAGRASIVISGGDVFVAKGGTIDCFGLDGARRWSQRMDPEDARTALGFPGNVVQADDTGMA